MRKMPGPEASATATKMLSVLGLTWMSPNGSALKTKVANSHPPAIEGQRQPERERAGLGAIAGDEEHAEQHDRKGEEDRRQRIGDRRLENARRHQEVEQEDDREGQHQIGQERQHRVDAAAEIAGRQAERDADRERQQRRQRRDDEHDAGAGDDPAEHVARQLVAAEQVGQAGVRIDRARRRVLAIPRSGRADRRARSDWRKSPRTARSRPARGRRIRPALQRHDRRARACGERRGSRRGRARGSPRRE